MKTTMRRRIYHSNLHDLFFSLIHGGLSALDKYISNGGSVHITGPEHRSLMIGAVIEGQEDVFQKCLDLGFDKEATDDSGRTALHWAASSEVSQYVTMLLAHGADPNRTDNDGSTALILAAQGSNTEVLKQLIEYGADVDIQNADGYTALHYSALKMDFNSLGFLLHHGSNTFLRTRSGDSAVSFSLFNKDLRNIQKILEHSGRLCEGSVYSSDLLKAVEKKYFDAVKMLLSYGIDPFPVNDISVWCEILTSGSCRKLRELLISEYGYFTSSGPENKLMMHIIKKHQILKFFNVLKLMFRYGYQIQGVLTVLTCKDTCLCRKVLWDLHNMTGYGSPGALQMLCRNTIRKNLRLGVVKKVASLALPPRMKRYLTMTGEFCLEKSLI